nr:universal stress protein [Legionella tucsonensis]
MYHNILVAIDDSTSMQAFHEAVNLSKVHQAKKFINNKSHDLLTQKMS